MVRSKYLLKLSRITNRGQIMQSMRPKIASIMLKNQSQSIKNLMKKRKKAMTILKTKYQRNLKMLLVGLISLALICLMSQILNLMVKCTSRRTSIFMMRKSILSKVSGLMVYLMESALLIKKI